MPTPQITVDAAFGSYPSDASYTWRTVADTNAFANSYVRGIQWHRGASDLFGRSETGTGSVVLRDLKRAWDPQNTSSPFYPNVRPDLPVRARAVLGGVTYNLFQHFMNGFPRQRRGPNYSEYNVSTVDGFAALALAAPLADNATLTLDPSGANNTLVYTARNPGMAEENISVQYYLAPHPLAIVVHHTDIQARIHYAGMGGNPGNTAAQVAAAINANPTSSALVTVANGGGSDGSGVIGDDVAPTFLSGGDAAAFPSELTGARIARCLDQAHWPSALRDLDVGTVQMSAKSFSATEQGGLLNHVLEVAGVGNEFGLVFVDGSGKVVFYDRNTLFSNAGQATFAVTFTDRPDDGFFTYVDAQPNQDREHVINEWSGSREGGVMIVVQDAASIAKSLGRTTRALDSMLTTDTQLRAALEFGRDEYGDPVQTFESITVKPGNDSALWTKCLTLDVGARIRVRETPPGGGTANVATYLVTSVQGAIPEALADSTFTYGLWPVRLSNYFVFDDATFGNLNTTVLSYN